MNLLALDIGTSFIKSGVLDLTSGAITHITRAPFPEALTDRPMLHKEYDALTVSAAARRVLDVTAMHCKDAGGIVMCGQMHGLVMCDAHGQPHGALTTWLDQRELTRHDDGGSVYDEMMARIGALNHELGNELRAGLPIGRLFWMAQNGQLPKGLIPTSIPDFLVAHWCGQRPSSELSNAHAYGALHLAEGRWHTQALTALGLDELAWPAIVATGSVCGTLNVNGRRMPIYTPVGDFQAALAGAMLREGELSLNVSTGSQLSMLLPRFGTGAFQTRPYFDGQFLATITSIPAGRALNALVALLSELALAQGLPLADPWAYINAQASAVGEASLAVDLSFFKSALGSEGTLRHMREDNLRVGELFAAAFDNMADSYARLAERVDPQRVCKQIVFSGGLVQKLPPLRERIVRRLALPWRMAPSDEDALFGLLLLGRRFTCQTE